MGGCHALITGCVTGRPPATRAIVFGNGRAVPTLKYFPPVSGTQQLTMLLGQLCRITRPRQTPVEIKVEGRLCGSHLHVFWTVIWGRWSCIHMAIYSRSLSSLLLGRLSKGSWAPDRSTSSQLADGGLGTMPAGVQVCS